MSLMGWGRYPAQWAITENGNGLDMEVEAVMQGAYWSAGDLRTYALRSDSDARATVIVRNCTLSL
jgi:hypothetical protein